MVVDRDDDAALLCDDVGGGAADAARRRGDQRHLIVKSHPFALSPAVLHRHAAATAAREGRTTQLGIPSEEQSSALFMKSPLPTEADLRFFV